MNVVFDLGGVVVAYDRVRLLADLYADAATRAAVRTSLVEHPDWIALDRGSLTEAEAVARAAARCGVPALEVERFVARMSVAWRPMPDTLDLLHRLRADGHALFCLSNMHPASLAFLERTFDFWPLFTGTVISCRVGLCKPEPSIYAHLLERHALEPADTVFVDDLDENLAVARAFGIRTVRFETADQCGRDLRALGVTWRPGNAVD